MFHNPQQLIPNSNYSFAVSGKVSLSFLCLFNLAGSADAWCGKVDNSSLQLTRRAYLANVRFVDEQIGEIVPCM